MLSFLVHRSDDPDSYYSELAEINTALPSLARKLAVVLPRLTTVEILRWCQRRHGLGQIWYDAQANFDHSWEAHLLVYIEHIVISVVKLVAGVDDGEHADDDVIARMVSRRVTWYCLLWKTFPVITTLVMQSCIP